jgi:superfamily I DNA and/or RNA helicase
MMRRSADLTLDEKARIQNEISSEGKRLREITKQHLSTASTVFTTVIQTCIENAFDDIGPFDAVIVDEASMMPVPYLYAVAGRSRSHLIIAGDFRQLGPIAQSKSEASQLWLHRDVFSLTSIADQSGPQHPALAMLTHQRRMHPQISECVNEMFYGGQLIDKAPNGKTRAYNLGPLPGTARLFLDLSDEDGYFAEKTQGGSRMNRVTAEKVCTLANYYPRHDPEVLVGVITPYRAQVRLIKRLLKKTNMRPEELERIHVGTVHTFQGSERDVLIWDLVESSGSSMGLLYREDSGNRLANVAITRAQGKLILVGDFEAFWTARGSETVWRFRKVLHEFFEPNILRWDDVFDELQIPLCRVTPS